MDFMVHNHSKIFNSSFQSSIGLRQRRSSFSPYLFILAMKALNKILSRAREGSFISSFKVG